MTASLGNPVRLWSRDDAANHLARASGMQPADLLVSHADVRYAFETASAVHPFHTDCEHCRRLGVARDILLGVGTPVTDGQGRLL